MEVGILGLAGSGKSTLFSLLTGNTTVGSLAGCRERGTLRLEGKAYPVRDGDVVHYYRFNV